MYGSAPKDIGRIFIDTNAVPFCFTQYLPIIIPESDVSGYDAIPEYLRWVSPIVNHCITDFCANGGAISHVYVTAKRIYGVGNREGWHSDGFSTDDTNYIWYDSHPTEFLSLDSLTDLPEDHERAMIEMERLAGLHHGRLYYPNKHVLKMDQSSIHRVNPSEFHGFRTFVKVSFSKSRYNLQGNAVNHALEYDWPMYERRLERNHTSKDLICK